jgi:hypothetical protein
MKIYKLKDFTKGWVVGDFELSIIHMKEAEFMVRYYKKGDHEARHVHRIADEITVIVSGSFVMNDQRLGQGDVVHLPHGTSTNFLCLEDGANAVFKTPSVLGDKYLVN